MTAAVKRAFMKERRILFVPLLSLAAVLCFSDASAFGRSPFRPPQANRPPATRPRTNPKRVTPGEKSSKSAVTKKDTIRPNKKTLAPRQLLPSDEGPLDAEVLSAPGCEFEPGSDPGRFSALFPNRSVFHVKGDQSVRLLVTMDGTVYEKETDELLRLEKGSILISPDRAMVVSTPVCRVELESDAVVTIDATADATYVRDYHDRWKGHVIVSTEADSFNLMPGFELIVTRESDPDKAWKSAVRHHIRRRDLERCSSAGRAIAFRGEFSIPDAILKSNHFAVLRDSEEPKLKAILEEVTKTAALLHLTDYGAPFSILH